MDSEPGRLPERFRLRVSCERLSVDHETPTADTQERTSAALSRLFAMAKEASAFGLLGTLLAAVTLVLALAGAGTALALADGGQPQERLSRTLVLKHRIVKVSTVDEPPLIRTQRSPETPGDQAIFISRLAGERSGRRYVHCTVVRQGKTYATAQLSCQVTYVLSDGSITAAGVAVIDNGRPVEAAITGGTGAYAGARGVLSSAPDGTDTLTLL